MFSLSQIPARLSRRHTFTRRCYAVLADTPRPRSNKVWNSADEAVADIPSGSVILSGGFGLCGTPETLISALAKRTDVKNFTVASNNAGAGSGGLVKLLKTKQLAKLMISYLGGNKFFEKMYLDGEIALELVPQGTLVERIRAHAAGIPAFYTATGANTAVETGSIPIRYKAGGFKEGVLIPGVKKATAVFGGKKFIQETAIVGDIAFVHAYKADEAGNCIFNNTANNYNAVIARNARLTIVEAEQIVPIGSIDPNDVQLPGIYVNRIVLATEEKLIENRTVVKTEEAFADPSKDIRHRMAKRAAKEIKDGSYINLGVGIPTLVTEHLLPGVNVWLQSENGILGMGPWPTEDQVDPDLTNAGKETCTLIPGASVFDSAESFAMIRGGHMDFAILGAMEVSAAGDIANYMIPGKLVKGMGGAMDLTSNPESTKIIALMQHCAKDGSPKILEECALPITAARAVSQIITELAVFNVVDRKLELIEVAAGVTVDEVRAKTGAKFSVRAELGTME